MFEIWGRAIYRRRLLALVITLIALAGAAAWGTGVFGSLQSSGGFTPPNSESQRASNLAARRVREEMTPTWWCCTAAPP